MTLTLAFRFVSGRYHATPYGHHVNEGLIEWPPSPWRLLRSLISVGYTSGIWNGEGPQRDARSLFESLAQSLPSYHLPSAVGTHSRHFMPKGVLDKGIEKTTLVLDTWARLGDQEIFVNWPEVRLSSVELSVLGQLLGNINYLGRSESWVEARIVPIDEEVPRVNCVPDTGEESASLDGDQVALLSATGAATYSNWREQQVEAALSVAHLKPPEGRKITKALEKKRRMAIDPYPYDLIDCLQKDTNWLRKHGWSQPPGSQRTFYLRPSNAISVGAPLAKVKRESAPIGAMLLAVTNSSGNDHALPSVIRTLPQGELLHSALVGTTSRMSEGTLPIELVGRDANRQPLRGPHEHAHIHPLDLDSDGHLDHILIWAKMGLSLRAQSAVRAVRRTYTKGGLEPLRLAVAAHGSLQNVAGVSGKEGTLLKQIVGNASRWRSFTPFVPSRHIKKRGKNTLSEQIISELDSRGLPRPKLVDCSSLEDAPHYKRFRHFVASRRKGPSPPRAIGYAIELEFNEPVEGPIALGYASHFGLGLFIANRV